MCHCEKVRFGRGRAHPCAQGNEGQQLFKASRAWGLDLPLIPHYCCVFILVTGWLRHFSRVIASWVTRLFRWFMLQNHAHQDLTTSHEASLGYSMFPNKGYSSCGPLPRQRPDHRGQWASCREGRSGQDISVLAMNLEHHQDNLFLPPCWLQIHLRGSTGSGSSSVLYLGVCSCTCLKQYHPFSPKCSRCSHQHACLRLWPGQGQLIHRKPNAISGITLSC